jgi:hypothetical protein
MEAETRYARCTCCGLEQPRSLDATGITARVCAKCTHHQGEQDTKRLARAESHERMVRERLEACRASESETRAKAAKDRAATVAALQSRGRLAARLVDAVDRSGNHQCPAQGIARDPGSFGGHAGRTETTGSGHDR